MSKVCCPHCGAHFLYGDLANGLIPPHSFQEGKAYQAGGPPCPGSGQHPRNPESDRRPLWKELSGGRGPTEHEARPTADVTAPRDSGKAEDGDGETPCRPSDNGGLCWAHPTCEHVQKVLRDKDAELKARREILDAICEAIGESNCWLSAAELDWRQRLRDFAEDSEQHQFSLDDWRANHETFPGLVLYRSGSFFAAYYEDAAGLWGQADDTLPMLHVMVQADPPHRTCFHAIHLHAWLEHLADIHLPATVLNLSDLEPRRGGRASR